MNCDQVFDILTRGPFPTGTPCDPPVEAHLNECSECRRLAEALRPALELFQESVAPEESRDLPGYWCAAASGQSSPVATQSRWLDVRPAPARSWQLQRLTRQWSALAAWRMAAMLALGVTLGLLASSRLPLDELAQGPPLGGAAMLAAPVDDAEPAWLAMMSPACRRPSWEPVAETSFDAASLEGGSLSQGGPAKHSSLAGLVCCTECHNNLADAPRDATRLVAQSCQSCHASNLTRRTVGRP